MQASVRIVMFQTIMPGEADRGRASLVSAARREKSSCHRGHREHGGMNDVLLSVFSVPSVVKALLLTVLLPGEERG